jgi:hypothetical protein
MPKRIDELSAEFAVSIDQTKSLIASWLGDSYYDDGSNNDDDIEDTLGITKLASSRQGLGSKNPLPERMDSGQGYKALEAIKRVHKKTVRSPKKETPKTEDSDGSSDEEGRSTIGKKNNKRATSFLDTYKSKKAKN